MKYILVQFQRDKDKEFAGKYYIYKYDENKIKDSFVSGDVINELINSGHTIIEVGLENTIKIHNSHFFATANYNCTFHENAALVKRASLFIGVDSCFAHIANCFNVPSVILLGSYKSFGKHTPFSNYRANRIEIYKHEISAIQETEVLNAAFTVQKF